MNWSWYAITKLKRVMIRHVNQFVSMLKTLILFWKYWALCLLYQCNHNVIGRRKYCTAKGYQGTNEIIVSWVISSKYRSYFRKKKLIIIQYLFVLHLWLQCTNYILRCPNDRYNPRKLSGCRERDIFDGIEWLPPPLGLLSGNKNGGLVTKMMPAINTIAIRYW